MLEFKVIQELKPNTEILEIIKNYTYITKNDKVKHLLKTNLQFIEQTEYIIRSSTTFTILEDKVLVINHSTLKSIMRNIISKKLTYKII